MLRSKYFNFIEEKINILAYRINSRGRLNILDFHNHSESFYLHLINLLFDWNTSNENENKQNVEAIDLIDHTNELVIQISATNTKEKIESSLAKNLIKKYKHYTFKFISISNDADNLRTKIYKNPHLINFNPANDIIDKNLIFKKILGFDPDKQKKINDLIRKELGSDKVEISFDFSDEEIKDIIIEFKKQLPKISNDIKGKVDQLKYDFNDIEKDLKNQKNGLSIEYYQNEILAKSLMDFDKIKYFLEDEINSLFKDYFYDITSELSGMITLKRDDFGAFEEVLIFIYQKIANETKELKGNKIHIKTLLHYMYMNCEIGLK